VASHPLVTATPIFYTKTRVNSQGLTPDGPLVFGRKLD
jgi:hypothetical protein